MSLFADEEKIFLLGVAQSRTGRGGWQNQLQSRGNCLTNAEMSSEERKSRGYG